MKKSRLKRLLAALLGRGTEKNKGDVWHKCPFCKHPRNKLSINLISESGIAGIAMLRVESCLYYLES